MSAAAALLIGAGGFAYVGLADATTSAQAATSASVIPHANSAWIYDGSSAAGVWAQSVLGYNAAAGASNKITQIYSYGTDIEDFSDSGSIDDGTYYDGSNKDNGIWDTGAYWSPLDQSPQLAGGGPTAAAPAISLSLSRRSSTALQAPGTSNR